MHMQIVSKIKSFFIFKPKNSEKVPLVDKLLLTGIILLSFLCFIYGDIHTIIKHGLILIESVLNGEFLFFEKNVLSNPTVVPAVYEFPVYLIFAVWNLPVYAIACIMGISPTFEGQQFPAWCLLWSKLLLLVCAVAAAYFVYKIAMAVNSSPVQAKWAAFLFLSSSVFVLPTLAFAQIDIISVLIAEIGVYFFIKNKRLLFGLCFLLAIPLKMFALFTYIPLICLMEKKIWKILAYSAYGLSGLLFFRVLADWQGYQSISTGRFLDLMIEKLNFGFIMGFTSQNPIPTYPILLVAICVCAYMQNPEDTQRKNKFALYIPLFVNLIFMMTTGAPHPYWIVLAAPYIALMIAVNRPTIRLNLLFDILGTLTFHLSYAFYFEYVYSAGNLLLLGRYLGVNPYEGKKYDTLRSIMVRLGAEKFVPFIGAVFLVCGVLFLLVNFPSFRTKRFGVLFSEEHHTRGLVMMRTLIPLPFLLLMLYCFFSVAPVSVLNTTVSAVEPLPNDILTDGVLIKQPFSIDFEEATLDEVKLFLYNPVTDYDDTSLLYVSVEDNAGNTLFQTRGVLNTIPNAELESFDLKNLSVPPGEYHLVLSGIGSLRHNKNNPVYAGVSVSSEGDANGTMTVNGQPTEYMLYIDLLAERG